MNAASSMNPASTTDEVVGLVRRLGAFGPVYVVDATLGERDGEFWFEVFFPESGERTVRTWMQILRDPNED